METISDIELINKVKQENCSDSLQELSQRHTALCFGIYRRYAPTISASGLCLNELSDDKDYVLYQAALSFNPEKKVKFSTWLGNNIRFQCLNAINKNGNYILLESKELNHFIDKEYNSSKSDQSSLMDYVSEILDQLKDKRIKEIFNLRYVSFGTKKNTWSQIGKMLNISTQTAINLHNKGRKILAQKLKGDKLFDWV